MKKIRMLLIHINTAFPFPYSMRHIINSYVVAGIYHSFVGMLKHRAIETPMRPCFPPSLK